MLGPSSIRRIGTSNTQGHQSTLPNFEPFHNNNVFILFWWFITLCTSHYFSKYNVLDRPGRSLSISRKWCWYSFFTAVICGCWCNRHTCDVTYWQWKMRFSLPSWHTAVVVKASRWWAWTCGHVCVFWARVRVWFQRVGPTGMFEFPSVKWWKNTRYSALSLSFVCLPSSHYACAPSSSKPPRLLPGLQCSRRSCRNNEQAVGAWRRRRRHYKIVHLFDMSPPCTLERGRDNIDQPRDRCSQKVGGAALKLRTWSMIFF